MEVLSLLLVGVLMVSTVLHQIVEPFAVLIDVVGPLLYIKELPLLAAHEARQNIMPTKCGAELTPWDLMVVLERGGISGPPGSG
jgi:hypothetical protein